MTDSNMDFAQRLTLLIETVESPKLGSRRRFAEKIGANSGMVTKWCQGVARPSRLYEKAIEKIYGASLGYLYSGQGGMLLSETSFVYSQAVRTHEKEVIHLHKLICSHRTAFEKIKLAFEALTGMTVEEYEKGFGDE